MVKYMGLGIACLTLVLSGVTRAVEIKTVKGICGKFDDQQYLNDKSCYGKDFKLDCSKPDKDICKDINTLKDVKDCNSGNDGNNDGGCKIDVPSHCDTIDVCNTDSNDSHCDIVVDHGCNPEPCGPSTCDPVAVPAPASSVMGGAGLAGIALMTLVRSRRSIKA